MYCAIFLVHWKREYIFFKRFSLLSLKSIFKMLQIQRKICFKVNNFFYRNLKKGNVVYIIFFIKVKDSNELSIAAHFFHCHLTGFLKGTSLHLCRSVSSFLINGVIVRNLNYCPWQWVYSISGCKVFLTVFNKLIEQIISAKKYEINWRRFQGNTIHVFPFCRKIWWQSSKTFQKVNYVIFSGMKIQIWRYLYKNVTNPEKNMF
jgi:hypothetical protein